MLKLSHASIIGVRLSDYRSVHESRRDNACMSVKNAALEYDPRILFLFFAINIIRMDSSSFEEDNAIRTAEKISLRGKIDDLLGLCHRE